jgi:SAM-dependent methyltransferase
MYDSFCGKDAYEVDERDDGYVGIIRDTRQYLAGYRDWPSHQKKALKLARGRVLDIGCGPGSHALHLQQEGLDVLGVDLSPLAIKVCRLRGLAKTRVMSITQVSPILGAFDTILMYGNNFGLFGNFKRARWLLKRFGGMTSEKARIIVETADPYQTRDPCHLAYHRFNRRRGRMGGQLRIRVRYRHYTTPWFDYLLASKKEMRAIIKGTGWRIRRYFGSPNASYAAVIEKAP